MAKRHSSRGEGGERTWHRDYSEPDPPPVPPDTTWTSDDDDLASLVVDKGHEPPFIHITLYNFNGEATRQTPAIYVVPEEPPAT